MTTETKSSRYDWLDILKFFGIFAVMLGHITNQQAILYWLYTFHVPLFFIAGGVVYRERDIIDDLKKRFYKIIVPYLFFGIIILLYYYFIERPFRDVDVGLVDGFIGLVVGDMDHLSFHSHLWFLPCYFVTVVIYNLLYKFLKPLGCRIVCGVACLAYVLFPLPSLPWGIDKMCGFLGLFALANALTEKNLTEKAEQLPIWAKLVSAALLIAVSVVLSVLGLTDGIFWVVGAVVGTAGFAAISMCIDKAKVLSALGRMTLVMLCIHGPIYRIIIKLVSIVVDIPSDTIRNNILAALVITVVTVAICSIAYIILAKIMPWSIGLPMKKREKIKQ